ncbi:hypothetical protein L1887_31089, partial [Cichorium endivia]
CGSSGFLLPPGFLPLACESVVGRRQLASSHRRLPQKFPHSSNSTRFHKRGPIASSRTGLNCYRFDWF